MELWLKALHVIAVIAWMAGLLYLPRLFVYHAAAPVGSPQSETFKVMERRLLKVIMNPAMLAVWILGPLLAWLQSQYLEGWFVAKIVLVMLLTGFHIALAGWQRQFAVDANAHSERFYRLINEVPALLMAGIVILVVVKPF